MAYRGLTTSGANYLATRLAQELPVEFTKVQIGAGTPAGNPADVTELQNYKLDAKILKKSQENNTVEITIQVVNDNVEQGFYLKEIGVFVNDDTEKLYWYCNEDNAQYIPAKTDSAIAFEIDIKMEVTNVESPILNWSGQGTWVNKDYLEEVLRNYTPNTRQMTAGKGLTGGGNFNSDKTFNVVSANDGIIVNEDNIQLNPVDDLSNSSTTRALAANQGLILDNKDKGIVGGYNGKFPLTSATKGNIYLLENTQKYYICITDYNGSKLTTPNANFEELSVYTNRSKLDNLIKVEKINVIDSFTNSSSAEITKIGNICMLRIDTGSAIKNDTTLIGKVMQLNEKYSKYYPSSLITVCAGTYSDGQFATFSLHKNGNITINRGVVSKDAYYITFVYSVDI